MAMYNHDMSKIVRARVRNGRLTVDEATDLPEGTEVALVAVADSNDWDLTDEQIAELQASIAQADAGEVTPAAEVLADLRRAR
jgi:predicted DNA-binding antitoxin AbrB/MazE fold protein